MYKSIVVGTDGSATARAAVEHAVELAKLSGGRVHIVAVCKLASPALIGSEQGAALAAPADAEWEREAWQAAAAILQRTVADIGDAGVEIETHPALGDPADSLITVAAETKADVIVVGNRGMSGIRRVLGSVPNKVSHNARCHLLIVHTT